jgi:hypothetical protein
MPRLKVLLKQESEAAARSLGVFGLTEGEQVSLMRLGKGEAWLLVDHDLHPPLYVAVNPLRLARLSSNSEQMQAIARASIRPGRGNTPAASRKEGCPNEHFGGPAPVQAGGASWHCAVTSARRSARR